MSNSNQNAVATQGQNMPQEQKSRFSVAITSKGYQELIHNTLKDPARANRFIASITSAVAVNPALQVCQANTILAGALLGESLNLSPSPQLGQYYLVPFNCKAKIDPKTKKEIEPATVKASFILGYKGYIQLALRSGQYKKLNVMEIKEGELNGFDPLNEEIDVTLISDFNEREKAPTIGYYAMFEYTNGFRKAMYWAKEKMLGYADKYSAAFSKEAYQKILDGKMPENEMWKYSSFWYKEFDDMAKKTMLRQLISHWGIMSTELQQAFESDNEVFNFEGNAITPQQEEEAPIIDASPIANAEAETIDMSQL